METALTQFPFFAPNLLRGRAALVTGVTGIGRGSALAVAQVAGTFGRLDIVVDGAVGNFVCGAESLSPNGFGAVAEIGLNGTFNVSRRPESLRSRGRLRRLLSGCARKAIVEACPLGRMAAIDDVSTAAVFLCSPAATFIIGVTLVIDGGLWLRSVRALGGD